MPDQIRDQFPNWLNKTAGTGRVVLVLDALNQLADQDHAPDLGWLPRVLPKNVRLIVSTLPGRSLDAIHRRDCPEMTVEPLSVSERRELIEKFLARFSRRLSRERVDRIAGAEQTANPLFLSAMLDELRQFGEHERLDEMIEHYLAAADPQDLYQRILARWEQDYDRDRPGLVRDALSLIWAARRGLSESELRDMLGENAQPLPRAKWAPLYLAAESSLVQRSGLFAFGHDFLRRAVEAHFLVAKADRRTAHIVLADYFEQQTTSPRRTDELPWQLVEASDWQRASDLLANIQFFDLAWKSNRVDVMTYWRRIEFNCALRLRNAYQPVFDDMPKNLPYLAPLSDLMLSAGLEQDAFALRNCAFNYQLFSDPASKQMGYFAVKKAESQLAKGELTRAFESAKEAAEACRQDNYAEGLAASLILKAKTFRDQHDFESSLRQSVEAEAICRKNGLTSLLIDCLLNRAKLYIDLGHVECQVEGLSILRSVAQLCHENGDRRSLMNCLHEEYGALVRSGRHDDALPVNQQLVALAHLLDDPQVVGFLDDQARLFYVMGMTEKAHDALREQQAYCHRTGDQSAAAISLGTQAQLLQKEGRFADALGLYEQAETLCQQVGNAGGVMVSLVDQAFVLDSLGRTPAALFCCEKAFLIGSDHGFRGLQPQIESVLYTLRRKAGE